MPSLLEQLGNEQAMLMHLAGELPPEDAAELEAMLDIDRHLKHEATELRQMQNLVFSSLERLDRLEPPPVADALAIRDVRRELNLRRLSLVSSVSHAKGIGKHLRYPWWAYPMATAAAVLLAFLVWWGNSDYSPHWSQQASQTASNTGDTADMAAQMGHEAAMDMDPSLRAAYVEARQRWLAQRLLASFSVDDTAMDSSDSPLAQAEQQLVMLSQADETQFPPIASPETNQ
jgi:anti-sigma factor RsiW